MNKTESSSKKSGRSKALWSVAFLAIAAMSIWAVSSMTEAFSFEQLLEKLYEMPFYYILGAIFSMLGFIVFEALALLCMIRALGHSFGLRKGFSYSAADIYFSAITPSATGGQPASALFMMKDGMLGADATLSLVANLVAYTGAMVLVGIVALIVSPQSFMLFSLPSKVLVVVGYIVQIGLLFLFIMLLKKGKILYKLGAFLIKFLKKMKLIRKADKKLKKLENAIEEYSRHSVALSGKGRAWLLCFIFNVLQRLSVIGVTLFIYLGSGGNAENIGTIFSLQTQTIIGAYCIPVPGSMGVTDYMMLDGFGSVMSEESAVCLELVSRSISFYSCIIICGLAVLIKYISLRRNKK